MCKLYSKLRKIKNHQTSQTFWKSTYVFWKFLHGNYNFGRSFCIYFLLTL